MQKLKIVLQSKIFYIIISFICLIYSGVVIYKHNHKELNLDLNKEYFEGVIEDYNIKDNKVSITLKSENKYKVTYYSKMIDKNEFCFGCKIKIYGTLERPNKNTVFHAFNYRDYLEKNNIYYVIKARSIKKIDECNNIICRLENSFYNRITNIDNSGYMSSFILGDKSNLDDYDLYQDLGISHLFAISGMHIGLFIMLLLKVFKRLNDYLKYPIVFIVLLIYGAVLGFSASVLRCIIFFILGSLNKLFDLNIGSIERLILTIIIILFINPLMIYNVGFQFSALTVFGIIYCSNYIYGNSFMKAIKISFIAFLFSFPISLLHFYSINLMSVIYNVFYIPYVTFIIYPLSLMSFILPIFYKLFSFLVNLMVVVSIVLNKINFLRINLSLNVIEVILIYLILFLVFRYNKKKLLLLIILILGIDYVIPYFDSNSYIYFLDVGQGDSMLLISSYRKDVILLDTGGRSSYLVSDNVINLLNYLGINKIDLLILSHGDEDHAGEVFNYINKKKIKHLKINKGELSQYEELALSKINNDVYNSKRVKINYLETKMYDNENDNSLITFFEIEGFKLLSMGDASIKVEKDLINKYDFETIDILKVGHHGSRTSTSKQFVREINPKYSVISVGKYNRYGHPNKEVLDVLSNSKIYRTDEDGSIMFKIKNNKLKIETCEP